MRIQIVSVPRSGSTYFYRAVNRYTYPHKSKWEEGWGEWFNPNLIKNAANKKGISDNLEKDYRLSEWKESTWMVIKTQMAFLEDEVILNACSSKNIYNIFFYRKNIFDMALSMAIAGQTDEFMYYENTEPLFITTDEMKRAIAYYVNEYEKIENNFYGLHFNEIVAYEDLTFNQEIDFHNLELSNMFSRKMSKAPDKKRVVNYEELKELTFDVLNGNVTWEYNVK